MGVVRTEGGMVRTPTHPNPTSHPFLLLPSTDSTLRNVTTSSGRGGVRTDWWRVVGIRVPSVVSRNIKGFTWNLKIRRDVCDL